MRTIRINKNLIQHDTGLAYLIKIPGERKFFWCPKKLTRERKSLTLLMPEDFIFKVFKMSKRQKHSEVLYRVNDICSCFGYEFEDIYEGYVIEDLLDEDELDD